MDDSTNKEKIERNITRSPEPEEGEKKVWQLSESSLNKKFPPNHESHELVKAIIQLNKQAKEQENRFKLNTEELEIIKKDTKEFIGEVKEDTKEFQSKIREEIGIWRYFIIGIVIVVALGFVINLFDIINYRSSYFKNHKDEIMADINNDLIKKNEFASQEVIQESKNEIRQNKNVLNCLEISRYFNVNCFSESIKNN